ncbi:MAG: inorganic diphosphatase [Candidatus Limnocylindrales bacterium]
MSELGERFPDVVEIVVEIPRGCRNKYEYDEKAHVFRLDRVLSSAVFYNFDYGFADGTRADDGDHTDALLIIDEPTFTGCHVWARPVGGLEMRDEHGFELQGPLRGRRRPALPPCPRPIADLSSPET